MTSAGNVLYEGPGDLPDILPLFPLSGALLLPRGQLPLNIFEPRYLALVDAALAGARLIGLIQPRLEAGDIGEAPPLYHVGCAGRLTSLSETGDGRYLITLTGVARFRVEREVPSGQPFRQARISAATFAEDFVPHAGEATVDRAALLKVFRAYLDAHHLETDWDAVEKASTESLVNGLSIMSPFGALEKQALLEAENLQARAQTLIAITEMALARVASGDTPAMQ